MNTNQHRIAILPWGDAIEDFLDDIGLSLDAFCEEMTGGWLFGYIEALQHVNIKATVFCFSARVDAPVRRTHRPTGATICILPASKIFLRARRLMNDPYGWSLEDMFGDASGVRRFGLALLRDIAPYLATPFRMLVRELRHEKCTAILCQEYEYTRFDMCVLAGKLLHLPVFATFQGGYWQLSRLERFIRPLAIKACAGLIIAPRSERQRVRNQYGVSRKHIARIFNPLDMTVWKAGERAEARAALGLPATVRIAMWHGRVDMHRKGLDVLLKAWKQVWAEPNGEEFRLLLIGTGPDAWKLRQCISSMDLQGIHWIDEYVLDRAVIRRCLSAADVYVLPSRHEGFPVAPIEAMACGLPVIAAAAPGVPDILEGDEAGGCVIPCGDAEELAAALGGILKDEEMSLQLGAQARHRAESNFSHEAVGEQLRSFLMGGVSHCTSVN